MDGTAPEVDGRFFVASLPYTQNMQLGWFFGALLYVYGFFLSPFWALAGLVLLFYTTPHPFSQELSQFKEKVTDVKFLEAYAEERGFTSEKYWMKESLDQSISQAGSWNFPAPSHQIWNNENPYGEDQDGSLILEHPFMIGAPEPPLLTLRAVYFTLGLFMLQYWGVINALKDNLDTFGFFFGFLLDDNSNAGLLIVVVSVIVIGYIVLYLLILLSGWMRKLIDNMNMINLPTTLVSDVVKGEVELIGQVRPGPQKAVKIYVDDDPAMGCSNLVCFEWVREDFSGEVDNQGRSANSFYQIQMRSLNRLLKSFADWLFVREPLHSEESARQRGGIPFILHDGSGGIRIEPSMFHQIRYQDPLKVWNVGKTRWTLYGLRLGDPVYIRGELVARSKKELADENLIDAPKNAVMKVQGQNKTPEYEYVLAQGSEHSILAYTYSVFETFYLPMFYLLAFLIMAIA